jgi:hypothetical protein
VGLHSCPKIIIHFVQHALKTQMFIIMNPDRAVAVVVTNYFF